MTIEVRPIDAIVYNQDKVKMKDVIAPPYDVISDEYRDELESRSEYNFVKLILANNSTDLSDENNRYNTAYKNFKNWLENGVLQKVEKPCIFYIIQNYEKNGKKITRKGFIARNRIEDFSTKNILPHEYTMGGPKEDRLNLTKKCKANFSQVFLVYSDPQKQIENAIDYTQKPFMDVTDDLGVQNIVYKIDDEKTISLIQQVLSNKTCLIADGHHRYETAMNYRNYINSSDANDNTKFVMSYFTNMEDDLLIFPTHRILTRWVEPYVLLDKVKKYFDVEEIVFDSKNKLAKKTELLEKIEKESAKQISMGLYLKNVNKFYLLKLRENVNKILEEYDVPEVLRTLDLIVLHKVIISKELGYTQEEQMAQDGIMYIKQEDEAFDMIDSGKAEASFIMAYPKIQDIKRISEAGERMPQKSTYFYPKLLSGIVINPLA
ncbi:DUF1015 domain-containing protein [bacterium]|nr:DUF1015 domain-containing protein [bacterium]